MTDTAELSRDLYLPRELVFDAWMRAEHVAEWYAPPDCRMEAVVVEPQAGGRFELTWHDAGGERVHLSGRFVDVNRPAGFECEVGCEREPTGGGEERLRVRLHDLEDACRIELHRSGVAGEPARAWRKTWDARLDRLESYFSSI